MLGKTHILLYHLSLSKEKVTKNNLLQVNQEKPTFYIIIYGKNIIIYGKKTHDSDDLMTPIPCRRPGPTTTSNEKEKNRIEIKHRIP